MAELSNQFRQTSAIIDLSALKHNAQTVRKYAASANIMAAIKANAYGHGIAEVAGALKNHVDEYGVASTDDALVIDQAIGRFPISVFSGLTHANELEATTDKNISFFIYDHSQLGTLSEFNDRPNQLNSKVLVWIKLDTGMSRLGFSSNEFVEVVNKLEALSCVHIRGVVSHYANADQPEHPLNQEQRDVFEQLKAQYQDKDWQWSLANSGGLLGSVEGQYGMVRPGIMLYGASPLLGKTATEIGLKPVMSLQSKIISIREVLAGESVGYGGLWTAESHTQVGVVACGYGDGYPRHISENTPVFVNGQETVILGKVSMDLIVVNLEGLDAEVGSDVELWGNNVSVDTVAQSAETIAYELMCGVTQRVQKIHKT